MALAKTARDIEIEKWDTPRSRIVPGSENSDNPTGVYGMHVGGFLEFPKMLYRGQTSGSEVDTLIVRSMEDQVRFERDGWATSPKEAVCRRDALAEAVGNAAAEAAHQVRRMSATAQAEYADAEATSEDHVTDVVSKRKPGRPPKVAV